MEFKLIHLYILVVENMTSPLMVNSFNIVKLILLNMNLKLMISSL